MGLERTGVFATDEQIEMMRTAMNTPVIMVGGVTPQSPQEVCHKCALESGLPEIKGYYGCDLQNREYVMATE